MNRRRRKRRPSSCSGRGRTGPLLALSALALALVAAELAARRLAPGQAAVRLSQFSAAISAGHEVRFEEVFRDDPELVWRLAPDVRLPDDAWPLFGLVSNGAGLREDHEVPRAKPPGQVRVLFLGDSCIFGYLVDHRAGIVELTEALLRERVPEVDLECLNTGVPGWSLFQGWRFLATEGFGYEPDLVVVDFGWNESARWDDRGDVEHHAARKAARPPAPLDRSRLAHLAWRAFAGDGPPPQGDAPRPRVTPAEYRVLLEELGKACAERGVDVLPLVGVARFNLGAKARRTPYQDEKHAFGRTLPASGPGSVDAVAALEALAAEHPLDELFFDGVHTRPLANEAIARALADALEPWLRARADAGERR